MLLQIHLGQAQGGPIIHLEFQRFEREQFWIGKAF